MRHENMISIDKVVNYEYYSGLLITLTVNGDAEF